MGGPPWPRRDPPARSGSFVSRAEPVPRPPVRAGARSQVCVRACVRARARGGGGRAGRTFDAAHAPQTRVGEVAAGAAGREPVVRMVRLVPLQMRAGVEPVVRADGDGHEREGGEGSGRGQQRLQPAVASHHGGRLIARRPPARPAAPPALLPSARRARGAGAGGRGPGGGGGAAPPRSGRARAQTPRRGGECGAARAAGRGLAAATRAPPSRPALPARPAPPLHAAAAAAALPARARRSGAAPRASAPPVRSRLCAPPPRPSPRSRRPLPSSFTSRERGRSGPRRSAGSRRVASPPRFPSPGHPVFLKSGPGDSNSGVCARARLYPPLRTDARTYRRLYLATNAQA